MNIIGDVVDCDVGGECGALESMGYGEIAINHRKGQDGFTTELPYFS